MAGALALGLSSLLLVGCGDNFEPCTVTKTCPLSDAGAGGHGGATGGRSGASGAGGADSGGDTGGTTAETSGGTSGTGASGGSASGGKGGASGTSGTTGASGDSGVGVPDGGNDATPPCDGTKTPSEASCVIDEQYGVFVSPTGHDDTGDGTRVHPYATINKGLTAAAVATKRVYVCADGGTYSETVTATPDKTALFGGFRCADWTYATALKSKIVSSQPTAWKVTGATTRVVIENLDVTAANAVTKGGSSIGMLVSSSANVVLRRVKVAAGTGMAGDDGTTAGTTPAAERRRAPARASLVSRRACRLSEEDIPGHAWGSVPAPGVPRYAAHFEQRGFRAGSRSADGRRATARAAGVIGACTRRWRSKLLSAESPSSGISSLAIRVRSAIVTRVGWPA